MVKKSRAIRPVSYDDILKFVTDKRLILNPKFKYFGMFADDVLVSCMGVFISHGKVKFHAFFTPVDQRGNGYFTKLFKVIYQEVQNRGYKYYRVDCLPDSAGIIQKQGFTLTGEKQFKDFKIYYFKKEISS